MFNRILMELYDDYENNNTNSLVQFANKTFQQKDIGDFFTGCVLILFSRADGFKPRYDCA